MGGVYVYTHKVIALDEDDFPPFEVVKEGFMPALGMFLICWVFVYTQLYGAALASGATAE